MQIDRQRLVDRERTGKNRWNYRLNNCKSFTGYIFTKDEVDDASSTLELWPSVLLAEAAGATCGVPGNTIINICRVQNENPQSVNPPKCFNNSFVLWRCKA